MLPKPKTVSQSVVEKNELLMPNDTNMFNNLFGGRLMDWMETCAGISAQKHSDSLVVTASVDNISFKKPIKLGSVVTIRSQVTRSFKSSMEVYIEVIAQNFSENIRFSSNSAYFTFVAIDEKGQPKAVPEVLPETEKEKELYAGALRRRQLRLILSGRLKPDDAIELKSIFQ